MKWAMGVMVMVMVAACGSDIGDTCKSDDDCDYLCLTDWPGGYCSKKCSGPEDCPDGTGCSVGLVHGSPMFEAGRCKIVCTTGSECEYLGSGYTCELRPSDLYGDNPMVCVGGGNE